MSKLTSDIKQMAEDLGFCKIGIAKAEYLDIESKYLTEWLYRGYHGKMDWILKNVEKLSNPRLILPDAKSILVTAMNYYTDAAHSNDKSVGKISRYAWGNDYHKILKRKLRRLLDYIKNKEPSAVGMVYVDSGPILEKSWAVRAGIGWQGKNSTIISENAGSWIFLGVIILNLELEYSTPIQNFCGDCTKCIDACPTKAIVKPSIINSNLCISYLTIEYRGEIAPALGKKFNQWIFGCDVCQDVCPWNKKFSNPTQIKEFYPYPENIAPKLESLVQMSKNQFQMLYHNSTIKRAKYDNMQRNVKIALNNYKTL